MQEFVFVTGMIIKQSPVGEYDRRVCILTMERGKISAFARGARKPGNRLTAATNPFAFGQFKLYPGKEAYTLQEADIQNYFEPLRSDFIGAYYGIYFAEVADYYGRENNDEKMLLKLLYQTLRAVCSSSIPNELVRCIYEIKAIVINGEFPGIPEENQMSESAIYAVHYIQTSTIEKLYTFAVTDSVLSELQQISKMYRKKCISHEFKSLEILQSLC